MTKTIEKLPFDRVVVKTEQGTQELRLPEFLQLPLTDRIRYILQRQLDFYSGTRPIDPAVALRALRKSR